MKGFDRFMFHMHEKYQKSQTQRYRLFHLSMLLTMVAAVFILVFIDRFIRPLDGLSTLIIFVLIFPVPPALMYWLFYIRPHRRARAEYLKREAQMQESDEQEPSHHDTLGD